MIGSKGGSASDGLKVENPWVVSLRTSARLRLRETVFLGCGPLKLRQKSDQDLLQGNRGQSRVRVLPSTPEFPLRLEYAGRKPMCITPSRLHVVGALGLRDRTVRTERISTSARVPQPNAISTLLAEEFEFPAIQKVSV